MADHESILKLATATVGALTTAGKVVTTAESCTGGWLAKAITDVPGSSVVFGHGVVSYANSAKESFLGVQNSTLEEHGSVSEPVVTEMADGSLQVRTAALRRNPLGRSGLPGRSETAARFMLRPIVSILTVTGT